MIGIGLTVELTGIRLDSPIAIKRSGHPLEPVFAGMLRRCYNKNEPLYHRYGGRGIKVCERWRMRNGIGFSNFVSDMGARPTRSTLDRIDNNGDYSPGNCRWADRMTQNRNRSNTAYVMYEGARVHISELAARYEKDRRTIAWRLKNGKDLAGVGSRQDNEYHRARKERKGK